MPKRRGRKVSPPKIYSEEFLPRLNVGEIFFLLKAYWDGSLAAWEKEDQLPPAMSVKIRFFLSKSTGKSLIELSSFEKVKQVIDALEAESITIRDVTYPGWYAYTLRCSPQIALEDPYSDANQDKPIPTAGHLVQALQRVRKLIHHHIL